MITPKEIANKIKQDAQTIQAMIKTRTGFETHTQQLTSVADTLLNDCKTGTQESHETHIQLAINRAREAIDTIATAFERDCEKKNVAGLTKQQVTLALYDIKSKLKAIRSGIEDNRANRGIKDEPLTYGKKLKHGQQEHGKQGPLSKDKIRGMFGFDARKGQLDKKHHSPQQPRRK